MSPRTWLRLRRCRRTTLAARAHLAHARPACRPQPIVEWTDIVPVRPRPPAAADAPDSAATGPHTEPRP